MTKEEINTLMGIFNELDKKAMDDYEESTSTLDKQYYLGKASGISLASIQVLKLYIELGGSLRGININ